MKDKIAFAALLDERTRYMEMRITDTQTLLIQRDETGQREWDQRIMATESGLRRHIEMQAERARVELAADKESTRLALEALMGLLSERDKALRNAREEQREAESKAEQALTLRLENFNEWRTLVNGERADLVRRDSHDQAIADINHRLDDRLTQANQRSDERMKNLLDLIERGNAERQRIRDDLNALAIRQATEDKAKDRGVQRFDVYVGALLTVVAIAVTLIIFFLTHH